MRAALLLSLFALTSCVEKPAPRAATPAEIRKPGASPLAVPASSEAATAPIAPEAPLPPLPSPFRDLGPGLPADVMLDGRLSMTTEEDGGATSNGMTRVTLIKVYVLNGDRFERVYRMQSSMYGERLQEVVGSPDGSVDLLIQAVQPRATTLTMTRSVIGGSSRAGNADQVGSFIGGFVAFDRSSVGLVAPPALAMYPDIVVLRGPAQVERTLAGDVPSGKGCENQLRAPKVDTKNLWVSPAGELFARGEACDAAVGVEVWKPGNPRSQVFTFDEKDSRLFAGDDGAVYLDGAKPQRWTGTAFEPVSKVPGDAPVKTADGREWYIRPATHGAHGEEPALFLREKGGKRAVELPPKTYAQSIEGHSELAGVHFAQVRDRGARFLVGLTSTYATAEALRDVIAESVPGSKPQIACGEPEIVRDVSMDL